MIKMNLLIYQNFTLGVFLNFQKGYDAEGKVILKVSYILAWFGLIIVFLNGYLLYDLVEKYYRTNRAIIDEEEKRLASVAAAAKNP